MGVVVASGSSPSAYIRGLIRRIDRGDPNDKKGSLSPARWHDKHAYLSSLGMLGTT